MAATKKRETRKSLSRHAWITLDGGFAARHCLVVDISTAGARITLDEDAAQLPGVIRLAFARDARTGRSCQVIWRRGKSAGIKFI
jgi:PilZ domain-containing protein